MDMRLFGSEVAAFHALPIDRRRTRNPFTKYSEYNDRRAAEAAERRAEIAQWLTDVGPKTTAEVRAQFPDGCDSSVYNALARLVEHGALARSKHNPCLWGHPVDVAGLPADAAQPKPPLRRDSIELVLMDGGWMSAHDIVAQLPHRVPVTNVTRILVRMKEQGFVIMKKVGRTRAVWRLLPGAIGRIS